MAYGKNPQGLSNVGSFRQTSHTWNASRNEKKSRTGGGKTPSWVNEYRPPTDDVDVIRVIQGNYTVEDVNPQGELVKVSGLTFWPYIEHFDSRPGQRKRCVCSAGPYSNDRNRKQPCHGCDLFWSSMKVNPATGKKEKGFMGKRDMVAFTILDYNTYHKVEQMEWDTGRVKLNEATGQPYYSWVRCGKNSEGRGVCDPCDGNKEAKQGHRLHWAMGSDHYNTLLSKDEDVGKCCVTCGGRDTIRNEAWLCTQCGEAIIDDRTRLTKKEIDDIVYKPVRCRQCQHDGFLTELISCVNCTPMGREDRQPKRATIFDVDLKLRRNEPSDGSNRTTLDIVGFADPRPIDKRFVDIAKPEELNRIYSATTLDIQARLFKIDVREPVTASSAAKPYGQGGGPNYG